MHASSGAKTRNQGMKQLNSTNAKCATYNATCIDFLCIHDESSVISVKVDDSINLEIINNEGESAYLDAI